MKDVVSSFAATAFIQAANVGSGILLARMLQPDGRGELAAVMLWPMVIAALGIFGIHEAVAYLVARRRDETAAVLRVGLVLGTGLSLILLPIGVVVIDQVFAGRSDDLRFAAFLFLAIIPLNSLSQVLVSVFQGRQSFGAWNVLRTVIHLSYLVLMPTFAVVGFANVLGFATALLLSTGLTGALAAIVAWRKGWFVHVKGRHSFSFITTAREILKYGGRVHFGAAVAVVAERLDQLIVSVTLSAADLGLYVVAMTMARLPLILAITFGTVAFPKVAAAGSEARQVILTRYTRATVGAVMVVAVILALIMPLLLRLFFGAAFTAAAPVALLLLAGAIPLSLKAVLSSGLKACDRGGIAGNAELVALVLSIASLSLLVPAYGLMGAAVASVVAQSGALLFMVIRINRELGIRPSKLLVPGRAEIMAAGDMLKALRNRAMPGGKGIG